MQPARAWEFLARWRAQAIIRLHLRRAWDARVRVERVAQVAHVRPVLVVQVDQVAHVRLVPVVPHVQVSAAVLLVQVSALVRVPVLAADSVPLVQVVLLPVAVVAAAEPLVHSARVVLVEHRRPESRSVRSAKNSNRDQRRALVAQLCHVAMARPSCAFVEVQACKTSQTRSMPMPVS